MDRKHRLQTELAKDINILDKSKLYSMRILDHDERKLLDAHSNLEKQNDSAAQDYHTRTRIKMLRVKTQQRFDLLKCSHKAEEEVCDQELEIQRARDHVRQSGTLDPQELTTLMEIAERRRNEEPDTHTADRGGRLSIARKSLVAPPRSTITKAGPHTLQPPRHSIAGPSEHHSSDDKSKHNRRGSAQSPKLPGAPKNNPAAHSPEIPVSPEALDHHTSPKRPSSAGSDLSDSPSVIRELGKLNKRRNTNLRFGTSRKSSFTTRCSTASWLKMPAIRSKSRLDKNIMPPGSLCSFDDLQKSRNALPDEFRWLNHRPSVIQEFSVLLQQSKRDPSKSRKNSGGELTSSPYIIPQQDSATINNMPMRRHNEEVEKFMGNVKRQYGSAGNSNLDLSTIQQYYQTLCEQEEHEGKNESKYGQSAYTKEREKLKSGKKKMDLLEAMLQKLPKDPTATLIEPEELLECRYLRLTDGNIIELKEQIAKKGMEPGIHGHMTQQQVEDYFANGGHSQPSSKPNIAFIST